MTTKNQRLKIIAPNEVGRIFDDAAISRLARDARVLPLTDLKKFGRAIRDAVRQYLVDANAPQPGEHRKLLVSLSQSITNALKGKPGSREVVAAVFRDLPVPTRAILERTCQPGENLPAAEDIMNPERSEQALLLLGALCHLGFELRKGRNRPGGTKSRPRLEPLVVGPPVSAGHPSNFAEIMLCASLGGAYHQTTDRMPPRWTNRRAPGPFVRLVREVLALAGAPNVDAVKLVQSCYGKKPVTIKRVKY